MATMNEFLSFQIHGNADGGGDGLVGNLDALLSFLTGLLGQSAGDIFASLIPGIAAMDNIHPLLVHFPIAFLTGFVLIDIVGSFAKKAQWREFATGLLYLGTLTAVFTVIAGFVAAHSVAHGHNVHAIMERHEGFGVTILTLAAILSAWRWKAGGQLHGEMNIFYLTLSAVLGVCIALGADLGGLMVYQYGVAVQAMPKTITDAYEHHHHHHD
jgi:uncharacterized membrane protein